MRTPKSAFCAFARTPHLEVDDDGVVWTRDIDTAEMFVAGERLGPLLGELDAPAELDAELEVLRSRWAARDRIEDLHAEASQAFYQSRGVHS